MRVIPVLDIKQGAVVRGIAGRREEYKPIQSVLTSSASPIDIAHALAEMCGTKSIYVADLDALAGQPLQSTIYRQLAQEGFDLWVDAGFATPDQLQRSLAEPLARWVVGLETLASLESLEKMARLAENRILFSLDLREGALFARSGEWKDKSPEDVAQSVAHVGIREIMILDIARVGMNEGVAGLDLSRRLLHQWTGEIYLAGGVRGKEDLAKAREIGVAGVLVASALHDGKLSRADVEALRSSSPRLDG